jgi:HK97 family phage prohead protease
VNDVQHKAVTGGVRFKANSDETGEFSAVFATLNVIDKDGDVTLPGAFKNGQEVLISAYQHTSWQGALPVGRGKIREVGDEAIVEGKFYINTTHGLDAYRTVKQNDDLQQWSYGFDTEEAAPGTFEGRDVQFLKALDTHEVSPVLIGAGENTRTLAVKARKDGVMAPTDQYAVAIRPHETRVTTNRWDLKAVQNGLPTDLTIDALRSMHAYVKADGDPTSIKSYGFLHHDGPTGDANLRACLAGIAQINGDSGGLTPAERKAVYDHLAQHLDDGDRDAPEFKATPGGELKFHEEAADVLMRLDRLVARTGEVMALRRSKGKAIAASTVDVLEWVGDSQRKLRGLLDSPQEDADREYARFIREQLMTGETP